LERVCTNRIPETLKQGVSGKPFQLGEDVGHAEKRSMAFIHEGSHECTRSELDLFSVPPTQTSIESGTFVEYRPISSITDGAPTGAQAFRVKITGAAMLIRKVKISPSVYIAHAKTLESGMAKYSIRRVVCKTFTIPTGYLDVSQEKLFSGQLPSRLILGCINNRAFNGDLERNPFNF